VHKASQRFERLAAKFEVIEHNLRECHKPEERRELLKGMLVVIVELDRLVLNDLSWLDSMLTSTAPTNRPLMRAAVDSARTDPA
jgi:hypothetical protein